MQRQRLELLTGSNRILNKSLNVSRETFKKFQIYIELLKKWQKHINLVSRGTLDDIFHRHIQDSLQIVNFLYGDKILDIGSGAGFPGMVIALVSSKTVTCLDSDKRKIIFLEEVARNTEIKVNCVNSRIESFQNKNFDTVVSRAVFPLIKLLDLTRIFAPQGIGVFLKGKTFESEVDEAQKKFDFDIEIHQSETSENSKILVIKNIR